MMHQQIRRTATPDFREMQPLFRTMITSLMRMHNCPI